MEHLASSPQETKGKVLIAAGGTGGHLFPGIALARECEARGLKTLFVGTSHGMEREVLMQEGFSYWTLSLSGIRRFGDSKDGIWKNLLTLLPNLRSGLLLFLSIFQSLWILLRVRPKIVIGMGGYLSFPILLAAWFIRKPTFISEQNLLPGLSTRILSFFAREVHLSFEGTKRFLRRKKRVYVSGNPVRREIALAGIEKRSSPHPPKTILIFGGSRGARSLNRAFLDSLPYLKNWERFRFILQTGTEEFREIESQLERSPFTHRITLYPFIRDMARAYEEADIVVSRAGASTCAEITTLGIPALLIPYPHATEGHQKANAFFLKERGAAEVIQNGDLSGERLAKTLLDLLSDENRLRVMSERSRSLGRPQAAQIIADRIIQWIRR